ncbi:HTH-type transcriptional activator RhaR [Paenibacillus sp. CECT 9249]|uniref:AraC family transcriptional regulator n=1 Tax=Paenibacillus sp. CECT 9249 TaxID=2845385 RepID=UPI001E4B3C33|nr:AraC family transcriptional regulator [Paenibacillus sp. CECT 9249]CAH0118137.1 HTH-type transcriptional activator RhaR [Paenibacillus sp. CECT 9249]
MKFYKSDLFGISRERKTHSSIPSDHYHDAYEILYIISGELYYFIGDRTYQVVGGVLLLINMNDIHKLINSNGSMYERVTLQFKKEFLEGFLAAGEAFDPCSCFQSGSSAIKLRAQEQGFVEGLFHKMIAEHTNQSPQSDLYLKLLLIELLIFIGRKQHSGHRGLYIESNRTHKQISRIVNYINHHYAKRLTLDDISKNFYMSPSHVSRTFKDSTGFTFIEYVNNVRVKEACTLLKDSNLTVSEIAERVGFDNLTHFGRIFKGTTGSSPLKYRKLNQCR